MYKSIFTPLSSNGNQASALNFSSALAKTYDAKANCVFTSKSLILLEENQNKIIAETFKKQGYAASQEVADKLYKEQFEQKSIKVKNWFDDLTKKTNSENVLKWGKALDIFGDSSEQITAECSLHDLTIASYDLGASILDTVIDGALFNSGRPLILTKNFAENKRIEDSTIILAWKDTPQTHRAEWFAMPILQKAKKIYVVHITEDEDISKNVTIVENHLAKHNVNITSVVIEDAKNPPQALEEKYNEFNADLIVMGAYSHSRLKQIILGGFTKYFLDKESCNLFLTH
ncbi:MAG: universal stress protein [Rickettsiales bacterium]|nr:universal stress protein [Rickettsiales bacterium]